MAALVIQDEAAALTGCALRSKTVSGDGKQSQHWHLCAVNVLATFVAVAFVDRVGRRMLLMVASVWMFVTQGHRGHHPGHGVPEVRSRPASRGFNWHAGGKHAPRVSQVVYQNHSMARNGILLHSLQ